MRSVGKRPHDEDSSTSAASKIGTTDRYDRLKNYDWTSYDRPIENHGNSLHNPHHQVNGKRSSFDSEASFLPPKIKFFCDIIGKTTASTVESVLEDTGIRVSQEDVEEVLKLSFEHPGSAVKFFKWSSSQLNGKHSACAWNLVVDLLGMNCLFDAMWDAIESMRKEMLLSLNTFVLVFRSYVMANRVQKAIMTFELMDRYGVSKDVKALNSLLCLICRNGKTKLAREYLDVSRGGVFNLTAETYAILLEGWEKEGNASGAKETFSSMVTDVGWDVENVHAYDSFLCTLLKGPEGIREALTFFETMTDRGCYPGMKFLKFAIDECARKNDGKFVKFIWETMVGKNICVPDTSMYKALISMYCNLEDFSFADKLLDDMVYNGAFPDSETYGTLFHFLIKHRRLREATPIFKEMLKNEYVPMQQDCITAVKSYIDAGDPYMGAKVWKCMIENYTSDLEATGNLLVVGLRNLNLLPEAVKYAEDMIERGIKVRSNTLSKLKQGLSIVGKAFVYEELLMQWKLLQPMGS